MCGSHPRVIFCVFTLVDLVRDQIHTRLDNLKKRKQVLHFAKEQLQEEVESECDNLEVIIQDQFVNYIFDGLL